MPIVVAQSEPKKSETVTQKVKREVKEDTKSVKDSVKRTHLEEDDRLQIRCRMSGSHSS